MNAGPFAPLLAEFNHTWAARAPELALQLNGDDLPVDDSHPLCGELRSLCAGHAASLPYFAASEVVWCTVAPDNQSLKQAVAALNAWVLPSFGGEAKAGDGYVHSAPPGAALAAAILAVSPAGYYRWRSSGTAAPRIIEKLALRRSLDALRPPRTRPPRPSLYELRARFASALLVGDRDGAEAIIGLLDSLQLETAVNTQFMRIRLWHHFRELDRIRQHPDLPHLLAQPLPPRVRAWIQEALGEESPPPTPPVPAAAPAPAHPPPAAELLEQPAPPPLLTWADWFGVVKEGKEGHKAAAETFLEEHVPASPANLSSGAIAVLTARIEEFYSDDALRERERGLVMQGASSLLDEFVREPGFPRSILGDFYLAMLHLWCALHRGSSAQEHGHVLLEFASACLKLNRGLDAVRSLLEQWWNVRPAPSQLPYALDAIELLGRELPDTDATGNLWLAAADLIKRSSQALAPSDRDLWRRAGSSLGFDDATIAHYLPPESPAPEAVDPLAVAQLSHVAIVCAREAQAREAAEIIRDRSHAEVSIVTATVAGSETAHACQADVVLFVWMASTHAVFRAFDSFDRKRFCYVQGTGASSIVRSLERWATML